MFHRTQHELPRTNNSVEKWHSPSNLSACHPTIYRILDILKREESMARGSVGNFPNMAPIQNLRSISHNLSL